jgi:hypothetical protein
MLTSAVQRPLIACWFRELPETSCTCINGLSDVLPRRVGPTRQHFRTGAAWFERRRYGNGCLRVQRGSRCFIKTISSQEARRLVLGCYLCGTATAAAVRQPVAATVKLLMSKQRTGHRRRFV